jgi:hypothetical protein
MGSFKDPTTLGFYTFMCFLLWFQLTTLNPGFDIHAERWVHLKTQQLHDYTLSCVFSFHFNWQCIEYCCLYLCKNMGWLEGVTMLWLYTSHVTSFGFPWQYIANELWNLGLTRLYIFSCVLHVSTINNTCDDLRHYNVDATKVQYFSWKTYAHHVVL